MLVVQLYGAGGVKGNSQNRSKWGIKPLGIGLLTLRCGLVRNNNPPMRGAIKREGSAILTRQSERCYSTYEKNQKRGFSMRTITRIAAAINTDRTVFFLAGLNAGLSLLGMVMQ